VPRQSKVSCGKSRHDGTTEQENAYRSESSRLRPDSEIDVGAIVAPHLLNISQTPQPMIGLLAKDHHYTVID
jgi:hypothetical protein